jgi:hypothetical protein
LVINKFVISIYMKIYYSPLGLRRPPIKAQK